MHCSHCTFTFPSCFCNLIGHSGPELYLGGRYSSQAPDSSSFPLPQVVMGGIKHPITWDKDSSSLPASILFHSGGTEGSGGGGGGFVGGGKYSPTPAGGSAGLSLHLNPTTLAMLKQHNYIPYFRGIKAHWGQDSVQYRQVSGNIAAVLQSSKLLSLSNS